MGNVNSNVHNAVKVQADNKAVSWFKYLDVSGAGEFFEMMKICNKTKQYDQMDRKIYEYLSPYLYNNGEGKLVSVDELVRYRSGKSVEKDKKKNSKNSKHNTIYPELQIIREDENGRENPPIINPLYREVCWDIDQRGPVGETLLLFCFLSATSTHYDLAKRIIKIFPKLINDYYMSEEYYGESVLHIAISNEDPAMVKYLLDHGANVNQRCFGNFFLPEDQKHSFSNIENSELLNLTGETNYEGHVYWGESPLSFAACCGQEECVRLLIAKGADLFMQDHNGNTALHMLVIHIKKMDISISLRMFDLLVDKGARLDIKNRFGLTPLTLAAKLGRKEMYQHIQILEREVHWKYGNVVCAACPLNELDTISCDGTINHNSALMHIVYGEEPEHLDMLEGIISHLLHEKWNSCVKKRFFINFFLFFIYFLIFTVAFALRPGEDPNLNWQTAVIVDGNNKIIVQNQTNKNRCYLLSTQRTEDIIRLVLELIVVICALMYICSALREVYYQGHKIFMKTLLSAPMKLLHLISCFIIMLMIPGRAVCNPEYEDVMGVMAILSTAPHFLFYCRGFRLVGPFVVMIYKMVRGDLLRFFIIYIIFLLGFSQAMYVVFRRVDESLFHEPLEALMGMFIMSLGEFEDIYEQFDCSEHSVLGKILFVVYMILVTLLLVNMLIAMMGNTYTMVNENQKEWLRQWAKIILVIEQSFSIQERRQQLMKYSQPLQDGRRAILINTVEEDQT